MMMISTMISKIHANKGKEWYQRYANKEKEPNQRYTLTKEKNDIKGTC